MTDTLQLDAVTIQVHAVTQLMSHVGDTVNIQILSEDQSRLEAILLQYWSNMLAITCVVDHDTTLGDEGFKVILFI